MEIKELTKEREKKRESALIIILSGILAFLIGMTIVLLRMEFSPKNRITVAKSTIIQTDYSQKTSSVYIVRQDTGDSYFYENDENRIFDEVEYVVFDNQNTKSVEDDIIIGFIPKS